MRITLLVFVVLCFGQFKSQSRAEKIASAKKMYTEITELEKNKNAENCKNISTETSTPGNDSLQVQVAEFCELTKGYSVYKANLTDKKVTKRYEIYLNNNVIFYVVTNEKSGKCEEEDYVYYDSKGSIIKLLIKSNNCDGSAPSKNSEAKDFNKVKSSADDIKASFSKIQNALKK
ncbi:MAG: hypothetical protein ACK5D5_05400 [Bacteroidota bacterium]